MTSDSSGMLSYNVVTPVRNEAENLRRLASCLDVQTVRASSWTIVDTGSTDTTSAVARELVKSREWVQVIEVPRGTETAPGAPVVRAFHAGLEVFERPPDVVVKLDADVSFEADYFERLLQAFIEEPMLGIAGGNCFEMQAGEWRPTHVTGDHVRGASRAYRWECLRDLLPLEERMGWDGIDELKAAVLGWRTRLLLDLPFFHHRAVGERDGARHARWKALGEASHYMGYRPSYLVIRALHHARRDPAALAMLWSYARSALERKPAYADADVRAHLRRQQSVRNLPARIREARGKRPT